MQEQSPQRFGGNTHAKYGAVKASRRAQGYAGRLKSLPPPEPRRRSVHYITQSPRVHDNLDRPKTLDKTRPSWYDA